MVLHGAGSSSSSSLLAFKPDQNVPVDVMYAPVAGPVNPTQAKRMPAPGSKATLAGTVERDGIDGTIFNSQYHSFGSRGFAADPTGSGAVVADAGRIAAAAALQAAVGTKRGSAALGGDDGGDADGDESSGVEALDVRVATGRRGYATAAGSAAGGAAASRGAGASAGAPGKLELVGAVKRARMAAGEAGDVGGWQGPWAGFAGEAATKVTALEAGTLTEEQKRIRVEQGYHADRAGKRGQESAAVTPAPPGAGSAAPSAAAFPAPPTGAAAASGGAGSSGSSGSSSALADSLRPFSVASLSKAAGAGAGSSAAGGREGSAGAAAGGAGGPSVSHGVSADEEAVAAGLRSKGRGAAAAGAGAGAGAGPAAAAATGGAGSGEGIPPSECKSIWHGKEEEQLDYQGRSWIEPPKVRPPCGLNDAAGLLLSCC